MTGSKVGGARIGPDGRDVSRRLGSSDPSDSRFFLEAPQQYLDKISERGVPGDLLRLMQAHQSTVLFQQITTAAAKAALAGKTGTITQVDYRGEPVLASYARWPFRIWTGRS